MKISCIKSKEDESSFQFFDSIGVNVIKLDDLDKTDEVIQELIAKKYNNIILTDEVAGFSGDIITKYVKEDNVNIIISPTNRI